MRCTYTTELQGGRSSERSGFLEVNVPFVSSVGSDGGLLEHLNGLDRRDACSNLGRTKADEAPLKKKKGSLTD